MFFLGLALDYDHPTYDSHLGSFIDMIYSQFIFWDVVSLTS
jgi:hypothetical protein